MLPSVWNQTHSLCCTVSAQRLQQRKKKDVFTIEERTVWQGGGKKIYILEGKTQTGWYLFMEGYQNKTCVCVCVCESAHALDPSICRCSESIAFGKGTAPCLCHCTHLLFAGTSPSVCPWQPATSQMTQTLPPRFGRARKKKKKLSARAHTDKQVLVDADLIDASAIANQNVISLKHSSLRRYTFEFLSLHFYILFYILIFFFTPLSLSHLSHRHTHCADDGSLEPRVKNSNKPLVHTTHSSETMLPDTLCHHPTHTCTHP